MPGMAGPRGATVLVAGGGVMGTGLAFYLSRAGFRVTLIEREGLGSGASGANAGIVSLQGCRSPTASRLATLAEEEFTRLARDTGNPFDYERTGGYLVALSEEEVARLPKLAERQVSHGLPIEVLDRRALARHSARFGPSVRGACYCPTEGVVNPLRLIRFFVEAIRADGAQVLSGCAAEALVVEGNRIGRVRTSEGPLIAEYVVVCGGVGSEALCATAGVKVSLQPRKNQVLITARVSPCLPGPVIEAERAIMRLDSTYVPRRPVPEGHRVLYLRQTREGGVLVGGVGEFTRNTEVTPRGLATLSAQLMEIFPFLGDVPVLRAWAGVMPFTPDDLPVMGPVASLENLLLCTGHGGLGVTLGPVSARLVAEYLSGKDPALPLAPFSADRFSRGDLATR